jgi:hypothetical protein
MMGFASAPDQARTPHALQVVYEDKHIACALKPPGIPTQARQTSTATLPSAHAGGRTRQCTRLLSLATCVRRRAEAGCWTRLPRCPIRCEQHALPAPSGARGMCAPAVSVVTQHLPVSKEACLSSQGVQACWPELMCHAPARRTASSCAHRILPGDEGGCVA